jgi:endonuclease YncB( thermonuclease family)
MRPICLLLILGICSFGTVAAVGVESLFIGRANVIDGDTIEIQGKRIRLNGIDAPESVQLCRDEHRKLYRCGAAAAKALDNFLAVARPTRCEFVGRDRYGRFVADCYRADGASVAAGLVRSGWALDWPKYSKGKYANEQNAAKEKHVGLWAGTFVPPWDWRAKRRASP